jgi:hypothetical protein
MRIDGVKRWQWTLLPIFEREILRQVPLADGSSVRGVDRRLPASGARGESRRGGGGVTPLMLAAGGGHADIGRCLIESDADPYRRNGEGETARMIADARVQPRTGAAIGYWEN